jgi:hypothetical protein
MGRATDEEGKMVDKGAAANRVLLLAVLALASAACRKPAPPPQPPPIETKPTATGDAVMPGESITAGGLSDAPQ